MGPTKRGEEINLWEYIRVLIDRKWLILIPTAALVLAVGAYSFLAKPVWEVDAILQPAKFLSQTQDGRYSEVLVSEPKQITGEINMASYDGAIAAEAGLDPHTFPRIQAENLRDTQLVRIWVRDGDVEKGKRILDILFTKLQANLNKKIDVELQVIDTKISSAENEIKQNVLKGKDCLSEITLLGIRKAKLRQEIAAAENNLKISEQRAETIAAEMKAIAAKVADFDEKWKKVLGEQKQGTEAVLMLLYSNEAQTNARYLNTLEESLSREKNAQETLRLTIKAKGEDLREADAEVDKQKNEIEKIQAASEDINQQIALLKGQKGRVDAAAWVKMPTASKAPVAPKKKQLVLYSGFIGLIFFGMLAFFLEYVAKNKKKAGPVSENRPA